MKSCEESTVVDVLCDVLEKLAFMFADPIEEDTHGAEPPSDGCLAEIRFSGDPSGQLSLAVPRAMCFELAANMLGTEPDDPEVEQDATDALKELLNVICGNLLTTLYGTASIFELTVPEVKKIEVDGWVDLEEQHESIPLIVDDHPALFSIRIGGED